MHKSFQTIPYGSVKVVYTARIRFGSSSITIYACNLINSCRSKSKDITFVSKFWLFTFMQMYSPRRSFCRKTTLSNRTPHQIKTQAVVHLFVSQSVPRRINHNYRSWLPAFPRLHYRQWYYLRLPQIDCGPKCVYMQLGPQARCICLPSGRSSVDWGVLSEISAAIMTRECR